MVCTRRLLSWPLSGALFVTILVGCGGSSNAPGEPAPGGSGGHGGSRATGGSGGGGSGGSGGSATASGGSTGAVDDGAAGAGGSSGADAGGDTAITDDATAMDDAATADAATADASTPSGPDAVAADGPAPTGGAGSFKLNGVATWRGNATAAYSIIHDDLCDSSVNGIFKHADPLMVARKLHGGFGAIVNECNTQNKWPDVKTLLAHGHDLFNHSWDHPCMTNNADLAMSCDTAAPKSTNFTLELDQSTKVMHDMLGIPIVFFIAPYDVCDPAAIARLKTLGYLGARCGDQSTQFNGSTIDDPFAIQFDVWGPAYSHYGPAYGMAGDCAGVKEYETPPAKASAACRMHVLRQYVEDTISRKGWAVHEFHGFEDDADAFEALSIADYTAHLDYVVTKVQSNDLWVEGPTPVLKYAIARKDCGQATLTGNTLKFAAPSANCTKYATTLTYLVSTTDGSDPTMISVHQGGKTLPGKRLSAGSYAVDADPTQGDATIE